MASTFLSRTNSTGGNRQVFTFSAWIKRSALGGMKIFDAGTSTSTDSGRFYIGFFGADTFAVVGGATTYRVTNQLFRDTSAWYHLVVGVDTTQATVDDRIKVYVNGSQVTSFSTNNAIALNQNTPCNEIAKNHDIGRNQPNNSEYFDGYMADINFIDGTQYAASDFGQTDSTGIWKPKGFSGTYGTNGAYLKMSNSGDLGADSSGNGNNFTKSGNGRQRTDTPSNVFATWNSVLYTSGGVTYSEGNTRIATNDPTKLGSATTLGASTGKWYCEMKIPGNAPASLNGVSYNPQEALRNAYHSGYLASSWGYYGSTGQVYNNNSASSYGNALVNNDILMIAMDLDNSKLYFGINGTWQNSGDPTSGATGTGAVSIDSGQTYFFEGGDAGSTVSTNIQLNTGNPTFTISSGNTDDNGYGNFEYAPPTGYLALCTKNLATEAAPTIDDGSQYFNTVLYTGNGGTQSITGVGFQPDWLWIKSRTTTDYHGLFDSNRGSTKRLFANDTSAESTQTAGVTSFDSDGFSLGSNLGQNRSSTNFVAWNWKVNGGTTSSNTDGSITSTVQANTTAGFSIVTYTGTGIDASVGHGLGVAPKMYIIKSRTSADGWIVGHTALGTSTYPYNLLLNQTSAKEGGTFDDYLTADPTSTVLNLGNAGNVNGSGSTYVAYCFAETEGYSKFGSYTGNGSTDGTFVYTGFRPAWVLWKRTDNIANWVIHDSARDTFNVGNKRLEPNQSNAELTSDNNIDLLSNGFKLRGTSAYVNGSGNQYIYMAFAENPFVTSGGLPVTAR